MSGAARRRVLPVGLPVGRAAVPAAGHTFACLQQAPPSMPAPALVQPGTTHSAP